MKELHDGVEYFDGQSVQHYEGRFSGTFELEDDDGVAMSCDDLVCIVVTARVGTPKFAKNKLGELKRTNSLKVEEAFPLSPEKAQYLLDQINKKVYGINDGLVEVSYSPTDEPVKLGIAKDVGPLYNDLLNYTAVS